jgi:hypothetical protein
MEFKPGESYYLVSTGSPGRPHAMEGGWCRTHNMRLVVRSASTSSPTSTGQRRFANCTCISSRLHLQHIN